MSNIDLQWFTSSMFYIGKQSIHADDRLWPADQAGEAAIFDKAGYCNGFPKLDCNLTSLKRSINSIFSRPFPSLLVTKVVTQGDPS